MIFERTPYGGFFGLGMFRGGIFAPDYWSSITGAWNETRYGIPNFHRAVDGALNMWQPLYVPRWARLAAALVEDGDSNPYTAPFGNCAILEMDVGSMAVAHLAEPVRLAVGGEIAEGGLFGYGGSTGNSTGPHAHIQCSYTAHGLDVLTRPDLACDPMEFLAAACAAPDGPPPPVPPLPVVVGDLPWAGGQSLAVTSRDCTPEEIAAWCAQQGAPLLSISQLEAGAWRSYIVGAPAAVNAAFPARLASSTGLYLRGAMV